MVMELASYEYTIEWRASKQHANTDALSHLPLLEAPAETVVPAELVLMVENMAEVPITVKQIASWTQKDPVMSNVYCYIQEGWPSSVDEET